MERCQPGRRRGAPSAVGSQFDAESGIFTWQLGPGFLGTFTLEFRSAWQTLPVRIRVAPQSGAEGTLRE